MKDSNLGRSIVKSRRGVRSSRLEAEIRNPPPTESAYNSTPFSITEQNDIDELLDVAALAGSKFAAERGEADIADKPFDYTQRPIKSTDWLAIPKRPNWTSLTSPQELAALEQASFLEWRRGLAKIEESDRFILTPFERNLDIWRQLWRVIENSNVVAQIVDARNPLLFLSKDLFQYVTQVSCSKKNFVILNKADLLTDKQRSAWASYLEDNDVPYVFYSAKFSLDPESKAASKSENLPIESANDHDDDTSQSSRQKIYTSHELISLLREISDGGTIGMVGYPNVGKSSTINSLIGAKKVAVAATPGKTKHFQTIVLDDGTVLCDCPGLVFPTFAASRADLVLNGILPIDQLKEWNTPIALLLERIPREVIESMYGFKLVSHAEDAEASQPTSSDLLSCHAVSRGFRTAHGNPDESRSARIILKDYVNAKFFYCHPPPSIHPAASFEQETINHLYALIPSRTKLFVSTEKDERLEIPLFAENASTFKTKSVGNHQFATSGARPQIAGYSASSSTMPSSKKHFKKGSKK